MTANGAAHGDGPFLHQISPCLSATCTVRQHELASMQIARIPPCKLALLLTLDSAHGRSDTQAFWP